MTPPAFDAQAIGEVQAQPVLFNPDGYSLTLKTVLGIIAAVITAIGALAGPTGGFIWAIYQRDAAFRDTMQTVVQNTKEELTAAVSKLDTRQTVTDAKLGSIETTLKSIDAKMEVTAELRARQNAADERMNRIERALERTGRTSATAHLQPNES